MNRRAAALVLAVLLPASIAGRAAPADPSDPNAALASVDRRLGDIDAEQRSQRDELARVSVELASRHARVVARGRAFYRMTRLGLLPIGAGFGAFVSYAMRVERARRLLVSDLGEETRLRGRAADLARDLERLDRDRGALTAQRAAMQEAITAEQDDRRREAAFDRAFETSSRGGPSGYVAVGGGSSLPPDAPAGGFATARGRLLFPVADRAEVQPATRDGTEGAGLEIRAPAGSPVRAVFAGRVAFADRYGPYGRIVILDHGDHYYTVSGNLDEIDVKIGQDVAAGDRIGTVGDDGRGSMLYFEVRHGPRAVPAKAWLGL